MKLKTFRISNLIVISICLLVITGIIYFYEEIKPKDIKIDTVTVVTAKDNIKENTVITSDLLQIEKRFKDDVNKHIDDILTSGDIIGMRTLVPIFKGEIISPHRIIENKSWMNEKSTTQIALRLNEIDMANCLAPNDYVDIWIQQKKFTTQNSSELPSQNISGNENDGSEKIFERLQVIQTYNSDLQGYQAQDFVAAFVIIQLQDYDVKKLLDIDADKYEIRICKHGTQNFYDIQSFIKEQDGE